MSDTLGDSVVASLLHREEAARLGMPAVSEADALAAYLAVSGFCAEPFMLGEEKLLCGLPAGHLDEAGSPMHVGRDAQGIPHGWAPGETSRDLPKPRKRRRRG